jgi:hypothetical protein
VVSPESLTERQHLECVRSVYELLKQTVIKGRALGLDVHRLADLIRAFDDESRDGAAIALFPVIATRDWYECMSACLHSGFPARLLHLPPNSRAAQFPPEARYLLSSYYMRGRAREIAAVMGRPVLYVRYNVALLDRAMTFPAGEFRYFVTRDADNADTSRQFLSSAYPEIPANRYAVMAAAEFLESGFRDGDVDSRVWTTITAAPLVRGRVPASRIELLHPLLADDFIDELRSLALVK